MADKTDVANRALSKLGEPRVSNIDTTNTKAARTIRFMWEVVRDAVLAKYPWNFAVKRVQLAKDGTAPAWGYNNRYQVPSDFLSLLEVQNDPDYRLEGQYILTNSGSPIYIRYISRVEDVGQFDPMFVEALASRLAYEGCEEITQSNTKKQILAQELKESISDAYANDAIQDPPQLLQEDEWILSRERGYNDDIDYNLKTS